MILRYSLHIVVFIASSVVMALEVTGLGILTPYFGTALIVQTNVIGVVLISLAIGYRLGGIRADIETRDLRHDVWVLLTMSALWVGLIFPFRDFIANYIGWLFRSVAFGSFVTGVCLFAVPSIFLGMVLPYTIKLGVKNVTTSGHSSGILYGLSTLGSIVGTFTVAFFILPRTQYVGTLTLTVGLLLLSSLFLVSTRKAVLRVFGIGTLSVFLIMYVSVPEFTFRTKPLFSEGNVQSNPREWTKLRDETGVFSRLQVYEGPELTTRETIRFFVINGEFHSAVFLNKNDLVFNYALYNRLGGHFNPAAKRALLLGGGGYSYANYFLTDTPLYDSEKVWELNGSYYHNNKTVTLPVLFTNDLKKRAKERRLVYSTPLPRTHGEEEGLHNHIAIDNQLPSSTVTVRQADILTTGFPEASGYVHVHETRNDGTPGRVISDDIPIDDYLERPRSIIGKGELISGENQDVRVRLDRPAREGEVLYAMLHRDNGNGRFDEFIVDGYEQTEHLDVVEIDPRTTRIAETYFHLNKNDPRLRIFHEDARTYLNRSEEKYDIIYFDAFRSFYAVPWQLATVEAVEKLYGLLNENGVAVVNIPAAIRGEYGKLFQAELKTYRSVFPEVRVFAVSTPKDEYKVQNMTLVAFKTPETMRTTFNDDPKINEQLVHEWFGDIDPDARVLTDDFAPTDFYTGKFANIHVF